LRFAARGLPSGPRKTRFRLGASLGRGGPQDPHGFHREVSAFYISILLAQAWPGARKRQRANGKSSGSGFLPFVFCLLPFALTAAAPQSLARSCANFGWKRLSPSPCLMPPCPIRGGQRDRDGDRDAPPAPSVLPLGAMKARDILVATHGHCFDGAASAALF